jgi:hypothetical protein
MADLLLSDVDVASFGVTVSEWDGVLPPPDISYATVAIPGVEGTVLESDEPIVAARSFRVKGAVEAASVAALETAVRVLLRWIHHKRLVGIRTGHDATKVAYGRLTKCDFPNYPHQLVQPLVKVDLTLECHDPLWYAVTPTALAFTTATQVPLGSWRVRKGVVRLTGVQNTPTVSITDWNDVAVSSFTVADSVPGASDYIEVDGGAQSCIKSVSSVITNIIDKFSGAMPVIDIANAKDDFSVWPKIARTAVSGTPAGLFTYAPTWL